jgi:CubicO group peptidase (beta-lactamase class C family)
MLIERGLLELEEPIARYWPEFAQAGKQSVRVRDAVAHTARLPGLEVEVTWQEATDDRRMAELLAAQPQSDDPRAANTYHALTYGWLCGELVRRVDGRSIGRFFAEEVAQPLELELFIGLPEALEPRVATLEVAATWGSSPFMSDEQRAADPLLRSISANPERFTAGKLVANERAWHAAEVPASNAIGTARAIAKLYGNLERLLTPATLELGRTPLSTGFDEVCGEEHSWGVGFGLATVEKRLGPPADAFGAGGAGGSCAGRWPTERVGFSYAMNLLRQDVDDARGPALMTALHAGLHAMRSR